MDFNLINGTGKPYSSKVDSDFRLWTYSTQVPEDRYLNNNGNVFSLPFSVVPSSGGNYFFYLKNTGVDQLNVTDVRIWSNSASIISMRSVTGTPTFSSASDIVPVNRNLGSPRTITATIKQDTGITNLTNGGEIFPQSCNVPKEMEHLRTTSNIIIPQNSSIAFSIDSASAVRGLVSVQRIEEIE